MQTSIRQEGQKVLFIGKKGEKPGKLGCLKKTRYLARGAVQQDAPAGSPRPCAGRYKYPEAGAIQKRDACKVEDNVLDALPVKNHLKLGANLRKVVQCQFSAERGNEDGIVIA